MSEDNKHFAVTKRGDKFAIAKYKPVYLSGNGTVDAEKEVWIVPANLFEGWEEEDDNE